MEASQGVGVSGGATPGVGFRLRTMAVAVALALGLSACGGGGGGGGGANVRPTQPPPPPAGGTAVGEREIDVDANSVTVQPDNLSGPNNLIKGGAGTLVLTGTNSYAGSTQVQAGNLYVDGDQSAAAGAATVASGATLGGKGIIGGNVTVADGATLAPGSNGAIGTLTINGNLGLSSGSKLDYDSAGSTTNGTWLSDFVDVKGSVTLDGTLNVRPPNGDTLGPGVYRLLNYGGTLIDNGLDASDGSLVQTGIAHQVNLISTQGMRFSFWDGDAGAQNDKLINGGNGTWQNSSTVSKSNWTDARGAVNTTFNDGSFAVFQAAPGTVTVDASHGDINVAGMQFASNGYVVQADAIHLTGSVGDPTHSIIRVGDGSAAGAGYVATINSVLAGSSALVKTDAGTLVLGGNNIYTGGTTINGGTLQVGNGGTSGGILGDVTNNGTLVFNFGNPPGSGLGYGGLISGSGNLIKEGSGLFELSANNTYTGGTVISAGTLQLGGGGSTGWVAGDITNNALLVINRSDDVSFTHVITGTGTVKKTGFNTLTVTGDLKHTGGTQIDFGTLQIGNGGTTGSLVGNVADNTILAFNRSDDVTFSGVVSGSGKVMKLGANTLTLTSVNTFLGGTYVTDGTLRIANGASLGYATFVGGNQARAVLRIDRGGTVGSTTLEDGAKLDNAGVVHFNNPFTAVFGGAATVFNHDGGVIETVPQSGYSGGAVTLGANSTLTNGPGSFIRGATGVVSAGVVNNDGGTISGLTDDGVQGHMTVVNNTNGALIRSGSDTPPFDFSISSGVSASGNSAMVNNLGGSSILGKLAGIFMLDGGTVTNDGGSVISGNTGISLGSFSTATGTVNNTGGSRITGTLTGIYLNYGGTITNGAGSTIETTGASSGNCSTTPVCAIYVPIYSAFGNYGSNGALTLSNAGHIVGDVQMDPGLINNVTLTAGGYIHGALKIGTNAQSILTLDGGAGTTQLYSNAVTATTTFGGNLVKNGAGTWVLDNNALQGVVNTAINAGSLRAMQALSGNVTANAGGTLDGVPRVNGNLTNAGRVAVHGGDSAVGGNYAQNSSGTLAVSLGSALAVSGSATLDGKLEITGADSSYVSNTHTNVLTATGGVTGTFSQLVKDSGVVFTATIIGQDANSVWLDTTGLNITAAVVSRGGAFTRASLASAQRVQNAFAQLDSRISSGNPPGASGDSPGSGVSDDFLKAAGQFQQAPTLQAAQSSLQSLSGQLHAASAAMTLEAIDASSRALADHFDDLLGKKITYGIWTQNLSMGGDMGRSGFDGVGFQLKGWMVGSDQAIGSSGVAGFAFGQSQGQQQLEQSYDHNHSRNTQGMFYGGVLDGNWYTQGRVGFGYFQQEVDRQLLLGTNAQGVGTRYGGNYTTAYGETGLNLNWAGTRIIPFVNVEYANIRRDGFAEQGAGGFGLRASAQTLDRWQAGVGLRANHRWDFGGGRALDFRVNAQFQRTVASRGDEFAASFVGLQQWQPLVGIGLSRYSGVLRVGLNAELSARTSLNFGYDYETGQRDQSKMVSARFVETF